MMSGFPIWSIGDSNIKIFFGFLWLLQTSFKENIEKTEGNCYNDIGEKDINEGGIKIGYQEF